MTSFHRQVAANRRSFLAGEIRRLADAIRTREVEIDRLSAQRAEQMAILASHGALDEYNKLQVALTSKTAELEINRRIALWEKLEKEGSAIRIEKEQLKIDARADLEDRKSEWEEEIGLFNANSEALYESSGELIIDVTDSGFRFEVYILRSGTGSFHHFGLAVG